MTPWELAKDTEHSQQRALFAWANCAAQFGYEWAATIPAYSQRERYKLITIRSYPVPELTLLFAIHNQGHGDRIRGAQAKAEGVKAGVPDLMLPAPSHAFVCPGLFIELKKVKKGVISAKQSDWGARLQAQGYAFRLCEGWIAAANDIHYYLTGSTGMLK